jgi:hypothetical protein
MINKWEVFGGKRICREAEVLGENVLQCHYDIAYRTWRGVELNPGRHCENPTTNRLSHDPVSDDDLM